MARTAHTPPGHSGPPLDVAERMTGGLLHAQVYAQEHWRPIAVVVAAVVALGSVLIGTREYGAGHRAEAATAFYEANKLEGSAERLEALATVADAYAGTGGGLEAAFAAAQSAFESEEYARAGRLYTHVVDTNADSPLAAAAAIGLGAALEAEGKPEEAVAAYDRALGMTQGRYAHPQAQLALARLAEAQGNVADALVLYREVVGAQPGTLWERDATARLAELQPDVAFPTAQP